ncbi:MAG: peptidase M10 [Ferruginibacter sp.]
MGEAEINHDSGELIICAVLFFYGNAANESLSQEIAADIAAHWNEPEGTILLNRRPYRIRFDIKGRYAPQLTPQDVYENTDPRNNYFRIEAYAENKISFVDGIGCNTGYFKLDNLLDHSTTAAHEFGHTIGLEHPEILDIRGYGTPGIMYPRGTIVDPPFQWNPHAKLGEPGDTMNPFTRKVLQRDIENLKLQRLRFNSHGLAIVGEFSSVWHDAHQP